MNNIFAVAELASIAAQDRDRIDSLLKLCIVAMASPISLHKRSLFRNESDWDFLDFPPMNSHNES